MSLHWRWRTGLWPSDIVGGLLWGVGFIIETTADFQKFAFKQDPANKGRFINTGGIVTTFSMHTDRAEKAALDLSHAAAWIPLMW
jgi:steroid 5-alpha reductase family enzyme